jgi:drug/metabolite transporter (DMT)-like permease
LKKFAPLYGSILLISSAGVLVRSIDMSPVLIAFWRGLIALILLGSYAYFQKIPFAISKRNDAFTLLLSSLFFAGHWVTYFYALQISSVAIGMLSLFTFPAITALLEPLYFQTTFNKRHLFLTFLAIVGLSFMIPEINFSNNNTQGIAWGVVSALCYALRNLTMKSNSQKYDSAVLMFYQFLFVTLCFAPFLRESNASKTIDSFGHLLFLGIFTTAIGHTLFVKSFKNFSIATASIIASSQPLFGVLLGYLFLHEMPNKWVLIGGCVVLSSVFVESLHSQKNNS